MVLNDDLDSAIHLPAFGRVVCRDWPRLTQSARCYYAAGQDPSLSYVVAHRGGPRRRQFEIVFVGSYCVRVALDLKAILSRVGEENTGQLAQLFFRAGLQDRKSVV